MITGTGRFADAHSIWVDGGAGRETKVTADKIIIAAGTRPARPDSVDFDDRTIVDSDGVINLQAVPRSMVVVGAGVIGMEYASMFAALGTKVTVVERRDRMLDFCDEEIIESLKYHLRDLSVTFRFGEEVAAVERHQTAALCILKSGKKIVADTVMYSAGRQGQTDDLALEAAGLEADERGRIAVDEQLPHRGRHTSTRSGDVIGFPALASTSMEQGRLAAQHACGEPAREMHELQPIGIYTIPEISFVGKTEDELTDSADARSRSASPATASWPAGRSSATRTACSSCSSPRRTAGCSGVHVFGTGATEIVHIGQAVMGCGGTVDYLVDAVFNYPTLSEAYKVAALDAINKIRNITRIDG